MHDTTTVYISVYICGRVWETLKEVLVVDAYGSFRVKDFH
jgi:hypothetical protein